MQTVLFSRTKGSGNFTHSFAVQELIITSALHIM